MKKAIYLLILIGVIMGCAPAVQTSGSSTKYSENLEAHRPKYEVESIEDSVVEDTPNETLAVIEEVEPKFDITDSLNSVLDSISVLSKEIKSVDGYTVQVYSGNNREAANIARGKVYTILKNSKPNLSYESPNFKVQVGQFYSTLEANETYAQLKKDFPNAILVITKFKIERD